MCGDCCGRRGRRSARRFTPAWSYLPAPLRATLAAKEGGTLFLPARTPLFYRYRSGATVANGKLSVPFTNRVRIRQGLWKWTKQTFQWEVVPLAKGSACTSFATVTQTFQVDGNKVYATADAGGAAWRCVVDRNGKARVLVATGGGKLGGAGLATVVASGLDVSSRTSAFRVSLVVTPSTVHRGRTVLVHGLAGDCTEGDAVAIFRTPSPRHILSPGFLRCLPRSVPRAASQSPPGSRPRAGRHLRRHRPLRRRQSRRRQRI